MKIIRPIALSAANIASNVPESAPAEYNASATYASGAQVSVTVGTVSTVYQSLAGSNTGNAPASSPAWWVELATTYAEYSATATYGLGDTVINAVLGAADHHTYESLAASNVGHPLTDAAWWLDLGPTNRFRMFDQSNSTVSTTTNYGIDVIVAVGADRCDGIALLNVDAQSVQVQVTHPTLGTIYDQTYSLLKDSGITSWYDYFTEEIVYGGDLVLTDLPLNSGVNVRAFMTSSIGAVTCGTMVLGQTRILGGTNYGARGGITDYSRKTTDDFGNTSLVERAYAKRTTYRISCENGMVDTIFALLAQYRATPVVWVGSEDYAMTWLYGWARDWAVEIAYPTTSFLSLEVEGLT